MRMRLLPVVLATLVAVSCNNPQKDAQDKQRKNGEEVSSAGFNLYDCFEKDKATLRRTSLIKNGADSIVVSSADACLAAKRVFGRVSFLFKNRDDILNLLGDPSSISEYNEKAKTDPNQPLKYVFSGGRVGWRYTLKFENGVCTNIEAYCLD